MNAGCVHPGRHASILYRLGPDTLVQRLGQLRARRSGELALRELLRMRQLRQPDGIEDMPAIIPRENPTRCLARGRLGVLTRRRPPTRATWRVSSLLLGTVSSWRHRDLELLAGLRSSTAGMLYRRATFAIGCVHRTPGTLPIGVLIFSSSGRLPLEAELRAGADEGDQ